MIIACIDVYYFEDYANASCIVFEDSIDNPILAEYKEAIRDVAEYIPGQFYKRELPCILKVLEKVNERIDLVVLNSFVFLENDRMGLGAHLYQALEPKIGVVGVAKTFFKDCTNYMEVYRGDSQKPLYVSSIGFDLERARSLIHRLKGKYRIPDVLKRVDRLSRERLTE